MKKILCWLLRIAIILIGLSIFFVVLFRFIPPVITPNIMISWLCSKFSGKSSHIYIKWRKLENISHYLIKAVIASEDQKFFVHSGFDWDQINKALEEHIKRNKRLRGASTISMQTARNVFLYKKRSWFRKFLEAYFTILIEAIWKKKRIIEVYLNTVEWGDGIYGAEAASQIYFNCSAKKLSPEKAALMAAVLPNPHRWSPKNPSHYIKNRQEEILYQMKFVYIPKGIIK